MSTRDPKNSVNFSQALIYGLAKDAGLFVPEKFPQINLNEFNETLSMADFAGKLLKPFLEDDPLSSDLNAIADTALNFPVPLKFLRDQTAVLELFHGPTCAFKDVGARFLAQSFKRLQAKGLAPQTTTVIVATSGDTGGAVASAFFKQPGVNVVILFPKSGISARQEKQLTAWGENIRAIAVRGSFDDCQRLVKEALADSELRAKKQFLSANSISLGRLLPQMVYHARASVQFAAHFGKHPVVLVPTGNLGNAVAALWAMELGFPIEQVGLITNANRAIPQFIESGDYRPEKTIKTLANAMDVGAPSNMERLRQLYPNEQKLNQSVFSVSVSDEQIQDTIRRGLAEWDEVWCPHTATAVFVREMFMNKPSIICATAHPAKFETIVEPLIGKTLAIPQSLQEILAKPSKFTEISPEYSELVTHL